MQKLFIYKIFGCILCIASICHPIKAQLGGTSTSSLLSLASTAPQAALGNGLSTRAYNASVSFNNPALVTTIKKKTGLLSWTPLSAGIHQVSAGYANSLTQHTSMLQAIHFINYGEIVERDELAVASGSFSPFALMSQTSIGHQHGPYQLGVSVKQVVEQLYPSYSSWSIASDWSIIRTDTSKDFNIGLQIKNLGGQLIAFTDNRESMPFDVQIGISKKLAHLPFTYFLTYHHLTEWDIYLESQEVESTLLGNDTSGVGAFAKALDNLSRHMTLGGIWQLGKGFNIQLGYNHLINRELRQTGLGGMPGFSFGTSLRIKKAIWLHYSRASFGVARKVNQLSIEMDLTKL